MLAAITGVSSLKDGAIIAGNGPPSSATGDNKDFYLDKTAQALYGPKSNNTWPTPPFYLNNTRRNDNVGLFDSTGPVYVQNAGAQTITLPHTRIAYGELYRNGVLQPDLYFTINGSQIIVSAALGLQVDETYEFVYQYIITTDVDGNPVTSDNPNLDIFVEEQPSGNIDGTNDTFLLTATPNVNTLNVFVNGSRLQKDQYVLTNNQLKLNTVPYANSIIAVSYKNNQDQYNASEQPVDETPTGVVDGINAVFALSYIPLSSSLNIYINGLRVDRNQYSLSNLGRITLNVAPAKDSTITAAYYRRRIS